MFLMRVISSDLLYPHSTKSLNLSWAFRPSHHVSMEQNFKVSVPLHLAVPFRDLESLTQANVRLPCSCSDSQPESER